MAKERRRSETADGSGRHETSASPPPLDPSLTAAARTLRGDIRDRLLMEFRSLPRPWQQMNEDEQRRIIHVANDLAAKIVNEAILIAAHEGAPHLVATVGQFTVKDGIKVQMNAAASVENISRLAGHRGAAVLVLTDPSKFHGQRQRAEPDIIGDLRLPKNGGEEEREDEAYLQQIGRGPPPAAEAGPIDGVAG